MVERDSKILFEVLDAVTCPKPFLFRHPPERTFYFRVTLRVTVEDAFSFPRRCWASQKDKFLKTEPSDLSRSNEYCYRLCGAVRELQKYFETPETSFVDEFDA